MCAMLTDRLQVPDDEVLRSATGLVAPLWDELTWLLAGPMGAHPAVAWGGREGWTVRYRRAGRPLVTLTPGRDAFQALIVLGHLETAEAEALPLGPGARAILDAAPRHPDGTWLFIPIETADDLADLIQLLEVKLPPRLRRAVAVAV